MTKVGRRLILQRSNVGGRPLLIWIEPWAEEFAVSPHSTVEVFLRGATRGDAEIDDGEDRVTIYAPGEALLDIVIDGVPQDSVSSEIAAPDAGTISTRGFVDAVFGNLPQARPGGAPVPQSRLRKWLEIFRR